MSYEDLLKPPVFYANPVTRKNFLQRVLEGENPKSLLLRGFDGGTLERSDVLVQAADGSDLNEIWAQIETILDTWNNQRDRLVDYLTYKVDKVLDEVGVPLEVNFEESSEYGQPMGIRGGSYYLRGYDFKFFDLAIRYTWLFLAGATSDQIDNYTNMALEGDNRLIFTKVMSTLFNPVNGIGVADRNIPSVQYKLYNGDGEVPPAYKNITFNGSHTHYATSYGLPSAIQNAVLQPGTIDDIETDFYQHGYTYPNGYSLVLWVNREEGLAMRNFRVLNGARYDFMPAEGYGGGTYLPASLGIVGRPALAGVSGCVGTYGPWSVIEEQYIPAGYVSALASGGPLNLTNPIGIREHENPAFRGLQLVAGSTNNYPLNGAYYRRGFGTGIRQRGGGFVVQMVNTATASYTVPAAYNQ